LIKNKKGIMQLTVRYGFMDTPNIPSVLMYFKESDLQCLLSEITYFIGRETIVRNSKHMDLWRGTLFALMSHNSHRAASYFRIPPNQLMEIGLQTEV
jgi:KUP system potassium uptake protein